jgi:CheY-like chemotaxis protein/HPt (histidine-containing phosphotransfer) domain-containing protein
MVWAMSFPMTNQIDHSNTPRLVILVVDDDELSRRMMKLLLSREGHQVELAANGMEAVEAIKSQKFDIVFMDLQMPGMDGIETSQKIRKWENGGLRTFIVALTASYLPELGQELFDAGMDNYLSKPFELEHIQRMLKYRSEAILAAASPVEMLHPEEISINDVLDFKKGVERIGGDIDTFWELLNGFIQELPEKMNTLQRYAEVGDLEGLSRAAHNLKGVTANLGILQLSEYADRLDKQSSAGYTERIEKSIKEIRATEGRLIEIAQIFLAGRKFHAE